MAKEKNKPTDAPKRVRGGVSQEVKAKSLVPLKPGVNIAQLLGVKVATRTKKDDTVEPVLVLHFGDKNAEREFYHTIWCVSEDWEAKGTVYTIADQCSWQDRFIAQVWNTFMGSEHHTTMSIGDYTDEEVADLELPEGIEGDVMVGWYYFFWKVAQQFTTYKKDGKPVYQTDKGTPVYVWLKIVLSNKDENELSKGNFIEIYTQGKESLLQVTAKDKITATPKPTFAQQNTTSAALNDAADMPDGF